MLVTRFCLAQRPALYGPVQGHHGRSRQARVMFGRFEDVIIQAGLHRLHCDLLVPRTGKHNDRAVRPSLFDSFQDREPIAPA